MDHYFDAAYFWGDIDHVMGLTIDELKHYAEQANRIVERHRKD
jgi:hypothetical protein